MLRSVDVSPCVEEHLHNCGMQTANVDAASEEQNQNDSRLEVGVGGRAAGGGGGVMG